MLWYSEMDFCGSRFHCGLNMNPQYLPQQPQQQYGSPAGPGFGPSPSGFPPVPHGGLRPSPSGTPGGFQLPTGPPASGGIHSHGPPGPQRMGPSPQGPPPLNNDLPHPGGPMLPGPGMTGASRSSHHPGFGGSNIANGPPVSSTGMQYDCHTFTIGLFSNDLKMVVLPDTVQHFTFLRCH
jgi:hypothetical protein